MKTDNQHISVLNELMKYNRYKIDIFLSGLQAKNREATKRQHQSILCYQLSRSEGNLSGLLFSPVGCERREARFRERKEEFSGEEKVVYRIINIFVY